MYVRNMLVSDAVSTCCAYVRGAVHTLRSRVSFSPSVARDRNFGAPAVDHVGSSSLYNSELILTIRAVLNETVFF